MTPRTRRSASIVWLLLAATAPALAEPPATPPDRPLTAPAGLRVDPAGPARERIDAVTTGWLLPAPGANPAILSMFADRDRPPYRDLLPWSGEFAGKYLTGATAILRTTDDPALRESLREFVAALLPLQDADGYLGPFPAGHRLTGRAPNIQGKPGDTWDAWGHYHMMLGLMAWDEAVGDPKALAAASRIADLLLDRFLGDKSPRLVDTGWTEMNLAPAHALVLLGEKTGKKDYLALARQIVGEFAATGPDGKPLAGDYDRLGRAGVEFFRTPRPRWESLHPIQALAALGRVDDDPERRRAFANLWWSIARLDRHDNGGFSSGEQARGDPYHLGAIETCCTIAWMAASVDMLKQSGDPVVADELELSTLNSAMGSWSPSGRWSTYDTPMDGVRRANFDHIVFQARPGSPELNCCSVNAARGLGMLSEWALLADAATGAPTIFWYGAGTLSCRLKGGESVRFVVETDYPRSGRVAIRVECDRPSRFPLGLRVPQWSTATRLTVAGEPRNDVRPATVHVVDREWKSGDEIVLDLDVSPRVWVGERGLEGRSAIYVGPVLLAHDPAANDNGPDDPAPIDARSVRVVPTTVAIGPFKPMVVAEARTADGKTTRLIDFASAGADGSRYRSWLRAEHVAPTPFSREHSFRTGPPTD